MKIVPANQNLPIGTILSANNLFCGFIVFDTTSGTPVQITGQDGQTNGVYPMLNVAGSNCYFAYFRFGRHCLSTRIY